MKRLAKKHPVVFSLLIVGVLFVFTYIGRAMYPVVVVGDLTQLDPSAFEPPTQLERMLSTFQSAEGVYGILAIVFAAILLTWLGWWREAGFTTKWRNLPLALPPLAIAAIALSDGVRVPDGFGQIVALLTTTFIAVFAEGAIFRGVMWRAPIQRGPLLAAALTSILSGAVIYGINATGGPVHHRAHLARELRVRGDTVADGLHMARHRRTFPRLTLHRLRQPRLDGVPIPPLRRNLRLRHIRTVSAENRPSPGRRRMTSHPTNWKARVRGGAAGAGTDVSPLFRVPSSFFVARRIAGSVFTRRLRG